MIGIEEPSRLHPAVALGFSHYLSGWWMQRQQICQLLQLNRLKWKFPSNVARSSCDIAIKLNQASQLRLLDRNEIYLDARSDSLWYCYKIRCEVVGAAHVSFLDLQSGQVGDNPDGIASEWAERDIQLASAKVNHPSAGWWFHHDTWQELQNELHEAAHCK